MNASRDPDRLIRTFLMEGEELLQDPIYDAVRAEIDTKRQRAFIGPWRLPEMNKMLAAGVAAAAVVIALIVGTQLLPRPGGNVGSGDPTATPEPSATPQATATPEAGLPEGPLLVFDPTTQDPPFDDSPPITVTIQGPGWTHSPENGALGKGDDLDPPEWTGAFLLTGDSGADGLFVYGDPCQWESTTPESPARTVDEIADALASQASRDATAPVDVTVGGYSGKFVTLHVPDTAPTREEAFQDCDQETFGTWNVEGLGGGPTRYQQGPGQVDEIWILDVDGVVVILDASYGPATPAELVDELRAIAESATFEAP